MSECDRIEEYLDEEMSAAERASMDPHVEGCAECRAAVAEYRRLRRAALDLPPVEVPDDLAYRIRQRLADVEPARPRPARIFRPAAFAGIAATAAAAIFAVVLVRWTPERPTPATPIPETPMPVMVSRVAAEPAAPVALDRAVSDWLVQAGNAARSDVERLRVEAKELRLLDRVRDAIPAVAGTADGDYLTAVSDLLVQLENGPGPGLLSEEARLVADVRGNR